MVQKSLAVHEIHLMASSEEILCDFRRSDYRIFNFTFCIAVSNSNVAAYPHEQDWIVKSLKPLIVNALTDVGNDWIMNEAFFFFGDHCNGVLVGIELLDIFDTLA